MILFSTPAYGFVELPEPYSTGSSAMPQKKNPDLLELVRGKSARVMGYATTLQTLVKGLPLAYNKDMQETQEPLFHAADTITTMLPLVTGFMRAVEFDLKKMEHDAQSNCMNAWAAAAYLVERGVPSRLAHEAVGKAVALATDRGCDLQKLPLPDLQAINPAFDAAFHSKLGLEEVLALHDVAGGTAPRHVKRALQSARERAGVVRLAAAGGILYALNYPSIDPLMGVLPGLKAFVAAVLGGIGNLPGAALGGVIIGTVETLVSGYISSTYKDAIAFALLILILLFKPSGLLGKTEVEKV
jgi:argininosuccinate lyase